MTLVDWAARWDPVPHDRPARVWLPGPRTPATAGTDAQDAAAAPREPRSMTLVVTPQQAADLPLELPHLLARQDLRRGDRITVDLADLPSVHLTGLALLMEVLWRRVGADGEVLLTGGTPGLRAQLRSLDITPARCRAAVHDGRPVAGSPPAPVPVPVAAGAVVHRPAPEVPAQRRPQQPRRDPEPGNADRRPGWCTVVTLRVENLSSASDGTRSVRSYRSM